MQRSRLRLPAKPLVSQPRRLMSLAKDAHAPTPHAILRPFRLQEAAKADGEQRERGERRENLVLLAYYFACAVAVAVIVIVLAITSIFGTLANDITSPSLYPFVPCHWRLGPAQILCQRLAVSFLYPFPQWSNLLGEHSLSPYIVYTYIFVITS